MNFSVLMSVYSKERPEYLTLSLESVLEKQSVKPAELVLVCDGPLTEELDAVIHRFAQRHPDRLAVHRLEKNSGLGNALRVGLDFCRYDYVARMDSDDICDPRRFEKQLRCFSENPELSLVGSDMAEFEEDPKIVLSYRKMPHSHAAIWEQAKFRNPICHPTVMFVKSAVQEAVGYLPLHYLEDYYLWVRMLVRGCRFHNINEPLVKYRFSNVLQRRSDKSYIKNWKTLSQYMYEHNMINRLTYGRNVLSMLVFVYIPPFLRKIIYHLVVHGK